MTEIPSLLDECGIMFVLNASLSSGKASEEETQEQDNLYFIKIHEEQCRNMSTREITRKIADMSDITFYLQKACLTVLDWQEKFATKFRADFG